MPKNRKAAKLQHLCTLDMFFDKERDEYFVCVVGEEHFHTHHAVRGEALARMADLLEMRAELEHEEVMKHVSEEDRRIHVTFNFGEVFRKRLLPIIQENAAEDAEAAALIHLPRTRR